MKHWIRLFSLALLVGLLSCEKDVSSIGVDIQPPEDRVDVLRMDTLPLTTFRLPDDSTGTATLFRSPLGRMMDPVFGFTQADFFTQIRLPSNNVLFEDNPVCDSVVLSVRFDDPGMYGPTDQPNLLGITIYEMTEAMEAVLDTFYYSNKTFEFDPTPLLDTLFVPSIEETVSSGELGPDTMNLRMPASFGQRILDGSADDLLNNENFSQYIKGLHFTTKVSSEMFYLDMPDPATRMTIYYHNDELDSLSYSLVFNSNAQRSNRFYHDYSATSLSLKPVDTTGYGEPEGYVQGLNGMRTAIRIPGLSALRDSNIIINQAIIEFPLVDGSNMVGEEAASMVLLKMNEEGRTSSLIDQSEGPDHYMGGFKSSENKYTFNIARHVHSVINDGEPNETLVLVVSGNAIRANRAVLKGSDPNLYGEDRMKLILTYTKP